MSDALDRRDRLAEYSGERGSMVLVTERRNALGAMTCEVCYARHPGGIARGVVLDEPPMPHGYSGSGRIFVRSTIRRCQDRFQLGPVCAQSSLPDGTG